MCIGIPMTVTAVEPGHAWCSGRGDTRRVRTALVGPVAPGDWLLVFLDSAQERMSPARAAEVNATLDLLQGVLDGDAGLAPAVSDPFELPSRWTADQLRALAGATPPATVSHAHTESPA